MTDTVRIRRTISGRHDRYLVRDHTLVLSNYRWYRRGGFDRQTARYVVVTMLMAATERRSHPMPAA